MKNFSESDKAAINLGKALRDVPNGVVLTSEDFGYVAPSSYEAIHNIKPDRKVKQYQATISNEANTDHWNCIVGAYCVGDAIECLLHDEEAGCRVTYIQELK